MYSSLVWYLGVGMSGSVRLRVNRIRWTGYWSGIVLVNANWVEGGVKKSKSSCLSFVAG